MKKAESIERYGKEAYERMLAKNREKQNKAYYIKLHGEEAYAEMAKKRYEGRPKLNKPEYIAKYGEDAYKKRLEQTRDRYKANPEKYKEIDRNTRLRNPKKTKAHSRKSSREQSRKNGRYYKRHLEYEKTGLRGERNKIRRRHRHQYAPFKDIIAPDSQLHHEWIPKTAEYRGVALVEANPHQYGIIDVIQILDGKITLLTEEDVRKGLEEKEENVVKDKMKEENKKKGRYLQLHYYVSDADEALILQAGLEVGRFLDICVEDAVKHAKLNLEVE